MVMGWMRSEAAVKQLNSLKHQAVNKVRHIVAPLQPSQPDKGNWEKGAYSWVKCIRRCAKEGSLLKCIKRYIAAALVPCNPVRKRNFTIENSLTCMVDGSSCKVTVAFEVELVGSARSTSELCRHVEYAQGYFDGV